MIRKLSIFSLLAAVLFIAAVPASTQTGYLTSLEKAVLDEMNLARTAPKKYAEIIKKYRSYYQGNLVKIPGKIALRTNEGTRAVDEAIRALNSQTPVAALAASKGMSLGAKDHVKDQGPRGSTGHSGSDGSSPFDRVNRYGKWRQTAGENISYGENTGRGVVRQLIIDDGVRGRGHRKNIYNAAFKVTGIACGTHKVYRHMCVITYAGGFDEK